MSDSSFSYAEPFRPPPKPKPRLEVIQGENPPDSPVTGYRAYGIDVPKKRPVMLWIEYADGFIELVSRHYLVNVLCASHQSITLIFTNLVIVLHGRNLHPLLHLIRDERLGSLHCFNPQLHEGHELPEGEVIITHIERISVHEFRVNNAGRKP